MPDYLASTHNMTMSMLDIVIRMEGWKRPIMAVVIFTLLLATAAQTYNNTTGTACHGARTTYCNTSCEARGMLGGTNPWFPGEMNVTISPTAPR